MTAAPHLLVVIECLIRERATVTTCSSAEEALALLRVGARYEMITTESRWRSSSGIAVHQG